MRWEFTLVWPAKDYLKLQEKKIQSEFDADPWRIASKKISTELLRDTQKNQIVIVTELRSHHKI